MWITLGSALPKSAVASERYPHPCRGTVGFSKRKERRTKYWTLASHLYKTKCLGITFSVRNASRLNGLQLYTFAFHITIGEVSYNGFLQSLSNTLRRQLFRRNAPLAARLRPEINSTPCSQDPAPATRLWTGRVDVDNARERAPQ